MTKKITPPSSAVIFSPEDDVILGPSLEFTPVPRATKRWNGITDLKQRVFIDNLAASGCVKMASDSVGTSTSAMYTLRKRPGAESFAAAWDKAVEAGAFSPKEASRCRKADFAQLFFHHDHVHIVGMGCAVILRRREKRTKVFVRRLRT